MLVLFAAYIGPVCLVMQAAGAAANLRAPAGYPYQAAHERRPDYPMDGYGHIRKTSPRVVAWIVVVVIGCHSRRSLTAPDVEAAPGDN